MNVSTFSFQSSLCRVAPFILTNAQFGPMHHTLRDLCQDRKLPPTPHKPHLPSTDSAAGLWMFAPRRAAPCTSRVRDLVLESAVVPLCRAFMPGSCHKCALRVANSVAINYQVGRDPCAIRADAHKAYVCVFACYTRAARLRCSTELWDNRLPPVAQI